MPCRYDPDQDTRASALIIGLCLAASIMVTALGMIYRGERGCPAPLPPEAECWDITDGALGVAKPCSLRPPEHRAIRGGR